MMMRVLYLKFEPHCTELKLATVCRLNVFHDIDLHVIESNALGFVLAAGDIIYNISKYDARVSR